MEHARNGRARWRALAGLVMLALLLAGCGGGEEAPVAKPMDEDAVRYLSDENLWRMKRANELVEPDGWTSLVGLHWLSLPSHFLGSSPRSGIRLAFGPPSLGLLKREGDRLFLTPDAGVELIVDGQPVTGRVELRDDRDGNPTVVGFDGGKGQLMVIHRGNRQALRVRHADAPTRTQFGGLDYWPPDRNWRVKAKYHPHPPGKTIEIVNIIGNAEQVANPGYFTFIRGGRGYRLEAVDQGDGQLSVILADRTSGHDSYGPGRYLDVAAPDASGNAVLDFNRAYNPPCAFTEFATCPLPPRENRLDLAITAGEKKYRGPNPAAAPTSP